MYLFILSVLMNIFTYMYYSKKSAAEEARLKVSNTKLKDSLSIIAGKYDDANYFSLENNQNAQSYFDSRESAKFIGYQELIPYVQEKLIGFNDEPKGNPYTGQTQIGAKKFIINKAKVLNHRWIIADYSDGEYWGEVLVKYFVNDDNTVSFETVESILYTK